MGLKSVDACALLRMAGGRDDGALTRLAHRFPVARPGYIVVARNYLSEQCPRGLYERLKSFSNAWNAATGSHRTSKQGLGYKESVIPAKYRPKATDS